MARFSSVEETLVSRISNDRLRTNLAELRQVMEDIWSNDSPRIIKDYTDHGDKHCERISMYILKLLEVNAGHKLVDDEIYLLLAGVYLHDIGMQCDVMKFPQILEKAMNFGAKFEVQFTSSNSNSYSHDEQISIRKNHQFLSVAWIDYSARTGLTVLGSPAKNIPEDLIDDLIDICLHHTKLPISHCPLNGKYRLNIRKQLVASLLRFADELDIESSRVNIETVKTYSVNEFNSIYWWMHHRTTITFIAGNVINISVRLHPNDVEKYGEFFHNIIINEFQTKNRAVITCLATNGIAVVIDSNSGVVKHERIECLPDDVTIGIASLQKKNSSKPELVTEVKTWMVSVGYEMSDPMIINHRVTDMVATLEQGTLKQKILVRCIDGEIAVSDVEELDIVLTRNIPQGYLISDKRVSKQARIRASEDDAYDVYNFSEFISNRIWGPYFNFLTSMVENSEIPELFVDLSGYKNEMDENGSEISRETFESLEDYLDEWLKERGKMHISILGEFGSGKTWLCRHYAYKQLKRYIEDPTNERLPLLITLRAFSKAMTVKQLINEAFIEQYKLPFVGSAYNIFQEMNRHGKILLILDGFDEMARQVDYQTVVDNFWELAKLVDENSKVILTSRTEYFRLAKESEKILGGEEYGRKVLYLEPPKFEVVYIRPFNNEQIRSVIVKRLGSNEGTIISNKILSSQNLSEMARKPVLIELLLAALEEVQVDKLNNSAKVYLYATNKLLLRNITEEKTFTSTSDKLYFLCELAWEMVNTNNLKVHFTTIPQRIKKFFGNKINDQHELDTWDFDLRNQTLLHRDAAGYYEFAHKSLAEYFVAIKFASELGAISIEYLQSYVGLDGENCSIPYERQNIVELKNSFGELSFSDERMKAVRGFISEILDENSNDTLLELINETKNFGVDELKYIGGNCATLLRLRGFNFKGKDFSNTNVAGADLINTDLSDCNLSNAVLRNAKMSGSILNNTNLEGADLTEISVDQIGNVRALTWSPDDKYLICGTDQGDIWMWNLLSQPFELNIIKHNLTNIAELKWNNQMSILACAGTGRGILLFNKELELLGELTTTEDLSLSVNFTNQDTYLYGGAWKLKVWDLETYNIVNIIETAEAHYSSLINDNYSEIYVAGRGETNHKTIATFKLPDGELINEWIASEKHIRKINIINDKIVSLSQAGELVIWESPGVILYKFRRKVESFLIDNQRNYFVIGCKNGDVIFWSFDQKKIISLIKKAHNKEILSMSISNNNQTLATGSGDGIIKLWDIDELSSTYRTIINTIEVKLICRDANIKNAIGLNNKVLRHRGQSSTLLDVFASGGAILDKKQMNLIRAKVVAN